MRVHYPRTPHLPWSPGVGSDDVRVGGLSALVGREVVVTEKLDGENTTLYADGLHARSLDSAHHPSRTWVKALHGRIAARIPAGWRVCGENVHARHSVAYENLDTVLRTGLHRLSAALTGRRTVVWDATCLNRQQRALVAGVAARRDALITHAVLLVDPDVLAKRNADRAHPVPAEVLATQLSRFGPPYPDEAHRTWYLGPAGAVEDVAGALDSAEA